METGKKQVKCSYRRQKTSAGDDRAFVEVKGQRIYLGKWNSPESKREYHRIMAEVEAGNGQAPTRPQDDFAVVELAARFQVFAQSHYPPGAAEYVNYCSVIGLLRDLYGDTDVKDFGPLKLKAIRGMMIEKKWVRTSINRQVCRIRRIFKWGVENELVPPTVLQGLQAVAGLQIGRTAAEEAEAIKPVPDAHIEALKPIASRQIWALIQLQLLTGARPSELLSLTPRDLDMSGKVWLVRPEKHKTAHKGKSRTIYFGPKAQDILRDFIARRALDAYLFSPAEATAERYAACKTHRREDQKANPPKTDRVIRACYDKDSYRSAIQAACVKAKIPEWTPYRLRHNAGTAVRRQFGLEGAQVALGHAHADTTQIYAEVNEAKAIEIALKIG